MRRRLLYVTDHRFLLDDQGRLFDSWGYNVAYFSDYLEVFDHVDVVGRALRSSPTGARVEQIDHARLSFRKGGGVRGARWVLLPRRVLRRRLAAAMADADAVCARIPSRLGAEALLLARRRGVPSMFELVGDPAAGLREFRPRAVTYWLGTMSERRTRAAIAVADCGTYVTERALQRRFPARAGAPTAAVSSVRIPESVLRPAREVTASPRPLRIASVASFVPVKAHSVLLRAFADLVADGVDATLTLIGDGPLRPQVAEEVTRLGLDGRVRFTGQIGRREDYWPELEAHDLHVLASRSEGLPRAVIEAMAVGLPCVSTDVDAMDELLPADMRVPVDDHRALTARLAALSSDPGRLSAASRENVARAADYTHAELSRRRQRMVGVLKEAIGDGTGADVTR